MYRTEYMPLFRSFMFMVKTVNLFLNEAIKEMRRGTFGSFATHHNSFPLFFPLDVKNLIAYLHQLDIHTDIQTIWNRYFQSKEINHHRFRSVCKNVKQFYLCINFSYQTIVQLRRLEPIFSVMDKEMPLDFSQIDAVLNNNNKDKFFRFKNMLASLLTEEMGQNLVDSSGQLINSGLSDVAIDRVLQYSVENSLLSF